MHLRTLRAGVAAIVLATVALPAYASKADVVKSIDEILNKPIFDRGFHGVVVKALDTGEIIYTKNENKLFNTASNMKLLTSAAALDLLGPDYKYVTEIKADKAASDGVIIGNLTIIGSGDPLLKPENLQGMVEQIKGLGIRKIVGDIVGDTGNFDRSPYGWGWSWDYLTDYYAAPAGALNLNENVVELFVTPGEKEGDTANVTLKPANTHLRVVNRVITGAKGTTKSISRERELGGTTLNVSGKVAVGDSSLGSSGTASVADPARFTTDVLWHMLKDAGIEVTGRPRLGSAPRGAVTVARYTSPPMTETLTNFNKISNNLVGECLLRTLGSKFKDYGSIGQGRTAAFEFFKRAGMDLDGINMVDGSGLSRMDYVTPGNFITLLTFMDKHKDGEAYRKTLPIAGVDGTLRNRMKGTPAEKNALGKTGYIGLTSSLSGYVTTAAGQPLAYSILFNGQKDTIAPCREAQDNIVSLLAGTKEKL